VSRRARGTRASRLRRQPIDFGSVTAQARTIAPPGGGAFESMRFVPETGGLLGVVLEICASG
jgi:hypothetical protein